MGSLILAALVLAVVGGGIAYWGDRLGTYVGKKRISRFGLRPRHTATLYTTLSGSAIAVLTLVVLVSFDSAFKRALLEGPRLLFENQQYKTQITSAQQAAATAERQRQAAALQLLQAQSRLEPVQQQLTGVRRQLDRNQATLLNRQKQLGQAQARLADAQVGLGVTNQQLGLARGEVRQAKQAVVAAESEVRTAKQKVAQQQRHLVALQSTAKRLTIANADLRTNNALLKIERAGLQERTASSQQALIFRSKQELGRLVVKAAQPVPLIENDLTAFLESLGRTAEDRGATKGTRWRAAVVAVPVSLGSGEYRPLTLVEEGKALKTLAQQIASPSSKIHSVVVVARTVTNTFQGEQAYLSLEPYENELIYHKGEPIATETISAAQTLQIVDALGTFLHDKVRPAVLNQRLIPQMDPETGQPMIGSVDEATSQALAQQIERLGGSAHVTAYASEDTYSSGPLHLRFDVTPIGPLGPVVPSVAVGGRT